METREKLSPTPERERQAHAGSVEKVEVLSDKGERVEVEAPKKFLSTIERLHRDETITDEEKDAAESYYRDWFIGCQPSRIIPRYAEYIGQSHDGERSYDAAERKRDHHNSYIKATDALGPSLTPVVSWLVLEVPMANGVGPATIEQVGLTLGPYTNGKRAAGYAVGKLSAALSILQRFYKT